MSRSNRRYRIPASAELALKAPLSSKLKELWAAAQENSFHLFLYAAGLRNRYLDDATGEYSREFQQWYATHEMHTLFGKLPTFTKYAMAGNVVTFFANDFSDGKYVNHLPPSRSALYEIWLLKDKVSSSELEKLLFKGGNDGDALISPSATASEIAAYRNRLDFKPSSRTKSKKFNIPLATIYVNRDLYGFQKGTGQHIGAVDLQDAEKLLDTISGRLDPDKFEVRDNLAKIATTYKKKADAASPSAALRKSKSKKPSRKKTH